MRWFSMVSLCALVSAVQILGVKSAAAPPGLPIIDMHLHALPADAYGQAGLPNPATGKPSTALTTEAIMRATVAALEQYNITRAVTSGKSLELMDKWRNTAPERIVVSLAVERGDRHGQAGLREPTVELVRKQLTEWRAQMIGEIGAQYDGLTLSDPYYEPYLTVAEELDLPVGIHTGMSGPGMPYLGAPGFRASLGNPLLIEEALVRHPKVRVYLMHAGYPYLEETIALMHTYPHVYADISAFNWINSREEFHAYLRGLLAHGDDCESIGKRLMFGTDQILWPEGIGMAIEAVEAAPFLTNEQKRDIFCNNAARFLRLDVERTCGSTAPVQVE
jgi:predicted TIM-barrel fold metal-dependent hydrolase